MVIILQQTTDNGKRFVSTVVEEESSFNSNFSLVSQNSISERSAIYKQRIDSLFGRHTRLNPFKPTLEPFCIRIEGSSNNNSNSSTSSSSSCSSNSSTSSSNSSGSSNSSNCSGSGSGIGGSSHHHHGNVIGEISSRTTPCTSSTQLQHIAPTTTTTVTTPSNIHPTSSTPSAVSPRKNVPTERQDVDSSSSDEDDDYEKIQETNCSIVTDSLNNSNHSSNINSSNNCLARSDSRNQNSDNLHNPVERTSSQISVNHRKCSSRNSVSNVSSVRLNCEDVKSNSTNTNSRSPTNFLHSSNNSSMARDMGNKTVGESHMWRNGTYAESPCHTEERRTEFGIVRASPGGILKFSVDYLGSIPVDGTATALHDLQAPLRNLYLNFLSGTNVMSGQLAITSEGLRFEAPRVRLVNPFTTIAVWAAIKFVARGEPNPTDCAFMPLISDPEGQDKSRLFGRMNPELSRAYNACITNSHGHRVFRNPPIFACVMREASFSLDCHAFACKCAEDAIVIAANLYQSLVDKMRTTNKEGESGYGSLTRNSPATQSQSSPNENRSCSSASSTGSPHDRSGSRSGSCSGGGCCSGAGSGGDISGGDLIKRDSRVVFSDSESIAPVRPPRRKKKTFDSSASGNLKRYNSDDSVLLKMPHRRKSLKGNYHYQHLQNNKAKKRVQISTPDETTTSSDSVSESIDQVLDRIINPGGMSFNDLKPPYQELILKIALTLTQDQLYQKSKQAMKKHQQFNVRKKPSKIQDAGSGGPSDENSQFLNMLVKSFAKITSSKVNHGAGLNGMKRNGGKMVGSGNSKFKSKSKTNHKYPSKVILKKPTKEEDPFMSFCSGCVCDKCSEKCYCSLPSKHNVKVVGLPPATSASATPTMTASSTITSGPITHIHTHSCHNDEEDSGLKSDGPRKKSCGYDTDSCAESEKCYCSLQRVKSNGLKIYNINLDTETSDTDTNSYDFEPFHQMTNDQGNEVASSANLKTGSSRAVEILSYHPSKRVTYNLSPASQLQTTNAVVHFEDKCSPGNSSHSHCHGALNGSTHSSNANAKGSSGSRNHSSSSSSYLRSPQGSSDEMLSASPNSGQRNKVLLITGSSPSTRVMYKDTHHYHGRGVDFSDGKKSRSSEQHRNLMDITEDEDNEDESISPHRQKSCSSDEGFAPEKILSMKKTAEIAAMFTDLHLDQTTNVLPDLDLDKYRESRRHPDESNGSLDLEASLGYLP